MSSIEVSGKSYETDEEGYLVNLAEWNEDVGTYLAQTENVEMTDQHWEVINFLRDYYNEFQIAPAVRRPRHIGKKLGPTRAPASTCMTCSPTVPPSRLARSPACRADRLRLKHGANWFAIDCVGVGPWSSLSLRRLFFSLHPASPAFLDLSIDR